MIIYVFDERWGGPYEPAAKHRSLKDVGKVMVKKTDSLPQIVKKIQDKIKEKGQGERSIWLMHMCGHGNIGFLELGSGLRPETACFFEDLAKWMTPGGPGVVLHGCWTGSSGVWNPEGNKIRSHNANACPYELGRFYSGKPSGAGIGRGFELLLSLSRALGNIPVKAGIDVQVGDKDFELEGPTITVSGSGYILDDVTWRRRGQKRFYPCPRGGPGH